jgi:hypothetical protein
MMLSMTKFAWMYTMVAIIARVQTESGGRMWILPTSKHIEFDFTNPN